MATALDNEQANNGVFELQQFDVSEEEQNMIASLFDQDEIADEDKTRILRVLNRILVDKNIYIWRDDLRNSWLTVHQYTRVPANEILFEVFSTFPTFNIQHGLHNNQRELFELHFGRTIDNPLSRSRFPSFEKPEKREDQFIYAIAIAFCVAMDQVEGEGPTRTFPFIKNQLPVSHMKYVIKDILRYGLPTNDELGVTWIKIPYLD